MGKVVIVVLSKKYRVWKMVHDYIFSKFYGINLFWLSVNKHFVEIRILIVERIECYCPNDSPEILISVKRSLASRWPITYFVAINH